MNFFQTLFFWVTGSKAWNDSLKFHSHYFTDECGFLYGLIIAIVVGVAVSAIFYFGLCRTFSLANTRNWLISLIVTILISFFAADIFVIGTGKKSGFYRANKEWVAKHSTDVNAKKYAATEKKINKNVKAWKDVRVPFDGNVAIYGVIFFFIGTLSFKGYSEHGTKVPF